MTTDWRVFCAIPAALLCLSGVMGLAYFPVVVTVAASLVLGLLAASVQIRRPGIGVSLFLISAVALPIPFGPNDELSLSLLLAAGVCGCWVLASLLSRRRMQVGALSPIGVSIMLLAGCLASAAVGQIPNLPAALAPVRAQAAQMAVFAVSIGLLAAVALSFTSITEVKNVTRLFVIVGAAALVLLQSPFDGISHQTIIPRTIGSAFFSWFVAICAGQALFNFRMKMLPRFACAALALACLADTFINRFTWVSGWFPALLALCILLAFRFPRLAIVGSLVTAPLIGYVAMAAVDRLLENESYSLLSRVAAWKTLWQVIWSSPILGSGPANYYHFTELFSTLGWYVNLSSHQQYVDLAAQLGFVGLGLFVLFVATTVRSLWKMHRAAPQGFERAFALSVFAGVVASLASGMLADWVLPFVYNVGLKGIRSSLLFWLFLGLAIALQRSSEYRIDQHESTPEAPLALGRFPVGSESAAALGSGDLSASGGSA